MLGSLNVNPALSVKQSPLATMSSVTQIPRSGWGPSLSPIKKTKL